MEKHQDWRGPTEGIQGQQGGHYKIYIDQLLTQEPVSPVYQGRKLVLPGDHVHANDPSH